MSHSPQRNEKDCLNCGTIVQGKYCHVCGQENVVPKETFWSMLIHFFYDITHFDSSFFTTIKDLFFKPGFLSKEYMKGRRKSYLHPVRMYVFTSAFFFLLFFSFFAPSGVLTIKDDPFTPEQRLGTIEDLNNELKKDTSSKSILHQLELLKDTTREVRMTDLLEISGTEPVMSINGKRYRSKKEYDSLQKLLPVSARDSWITKTFIVKIIEINKKYKGQPQRAIRELGNNVLHKLPYLLLISLPLFALLLKLIYIRRKNYFYADHGIFTIHFYVFAFYLLLMVFGLNALQNNMGVSDFEWVNALLFILLNFYLYKAMRNFYGQKRWKTILKFLFVFITSTVMYIVLLAFFFFFSIFTI